MKGRFTINFSAMQDNYRIVRKNVDNPCKIGAVVKANGYSCGIDKVGKALTKVGANTFFVATITEAISLREAIGHGSLIAVFNGFWQPEAQAYLSHNITPVLNSMPEIESYKALAEDQKLPAIIHIDTAMNRLGLEKQDLLTLQNHPENLDGLELLYVMSHFASADDPDSNTHKVQNEDFLKACRMLPEAKKSLANAPGLFRNTDYHYDMVRPGLCLYGLNPLPEQDNMMKPVISLDAPILQIREAKKGECCGYNETYTFSENAWLAIVSLGYADGLLRSLTNQGKFYYKGYPCPIRGRVSMDLTTVDISAIPENERPLPGEWMEIVGKNQTIEALAKDANTNTHELLTSIGMRYERHYIHS
ncbi:MAG: alanine racemase [Bdellovibrionales bacterium]